MVGHQKRDLDTKLIREYLAELLRMSRIVKKKRFHPNLNLSKSMSGTVISKYRTDIFPKFPESKPRRKIQQHQHDDLIGFFKNVQVSGARGSYIFSHSDTDIINKKYQLYLFAMNKKDGRITKNVSAYEPYLATARNTYLKHKESSKWSSVGLRSIEDFVQFVDSEVVTQFNVNDKGLILSKAICVLLRDEPSTITSSIEILDKFRAIIGMRGLYIAKSTANDSSVAAFTDYLVKVNSTIKNNIVDFSVREVIGNSKTLYTDIFRDQESRKRYDFFDVPIRWSCLDFAAGAEAWHLSRNYSKNTYLLNGRSPEKVMEESWDILRDHGDLPFIFAQIPTLIEHFADIGDFQRAFRIASSYAKELEGLKLKNSVAYARIEAAASMAILLYHYYYNDINMFILSLKGIEDATNKLYHNGARSLSKKLKREYNIRAKEMAPNEWSLVREID